MNFDFSNKTIIITGASRGIGKQLSYSFAKNNANIVLISRSSESLKNLENELLKETKSVLSIPMDVSNFNCFSNAIKLIEKEFNHIDILINNAGITKDNLMLRMSENDWDDVIDVNLKGCFNGIKAVSKNMIRNKKGKIINISSIIGLTGNTGQSNYAASKAGIIGLTKSIAKEFASRNITVNAIAPGYIETDMTDNLNDKNKMEFIQKIPLKKLGSTQDVSDLVLFLCSKHANYITGQTITIDGGLTI